MARRYVNLLAISRMFDACRYDDLIKKNRECCLHLTTVFATSTSIRDMYSEYNASSLLESTVVSREARHSTGKIRATSQ